ncbi:hypothetical protein Y032_0129g1493 [Ancylostoma ceylanicum]|uniref:SCP domain-containing protein n=1 Tax=Ancylostoma ceylanicum TaxID=53326 RepID=A0A016T7G2_9BILA|nr:hypothetical protein Y032_0129g1493 [Ancylostoma ceylanicum]
MGSSISIKRNGRNQKCFCDTPSSFRGSKSTSAWCRSNSESESDSHFTNYGRNISNFVNSSSDYFITSIRRTDFNEYGIVGSDYDIADNDYDHCANQEALAYLTNAMRDIFLNYHNEKRGSLARGQTETSAGWGIAPPATIMYRMKYDCNAESYAQQAVNTCRRTELPAYATGGHKQNLFILNSPQVSPKQAIQYALSQWWSQLARFGMRSNMMFYQSEFNRGARNVLNWSKMAWWNTRYVGCAVKNCGSFYAVSCMYYPGGNNVNQYVYQVTSSDFIDGMVEYQVGAVCSGCPRGQCDGQALCRWG